MKSKPEIKKLFLVGIKGVAMTGLAIMAKKLGYEVTGSDVGETFSTDAVLKENDIKVFEGFSASNLADKPDLIVVSAAYGANNPELKVAKNKRIPVIAQSEMLGKIMANYEGIGVAGVHGKTTTSSLIAYIFNQAGFSPSYAIGASEIPGLGGNARIGDGKFFVVEADEYKRAESDLRPKFLDLPLQHAIITSIELDHPDVYQTAEEVYKAFYQLAIKIPRTGTIVACSDWPLVRRLVSRIIDRPCLTYGFEGHAQFVITDYRQFETTTFSVKSADATWGPFTMNLLGRHNALNATAAIIICQRLGVPLPAISKALSSFKGPQRRFEFLGKYNDSPIIADYAHHPTAIKYLLESARSRFPGKKIIAVFQPHTYSRTGKLLKEFAESLQNCDKLILLNIFASAREKSGYVTIKDLITEAKKYKPDLEYRSSLEDAALFLKSIITKDEVVLLIGAGDVYKIFELLPKTESA